MDENVITELKQLFKGERMAIHAYDRFIKDADDEKVKKEFQNIQKDHEMHAAELSDRIKALGGAPDYGTGFAGVMASAKSAVQHMGGNRTLDIIKEAYDGEDKGIAMGAEVVKGDLDQESAEMVDRMLSQDHDHLSKMAHMISDFELKQKNAGELH